MDFIGQAALVSLLIPIVAMLVGLAIVLFGIERSYRAKKLDHEERMKAIEKGYPIPAMPTRPKPNYPFAWPFVFIGFGIALLMMVVFGEGDEVALSFGFISLFIGLALLASRFVGVKKTEMDQAENTLRRPAPPPQPLAAPEEPKPAPEAEAPATPSTEEEPGGSA